ncbi:MAG: hypothetical protein ACKO33_07030 [Bacteroidota bacterium]
MGLKHLVVIILFSLLLLPITSWGQAQETYADEQRQQLLRRKEAMLFKPVSITETTQEVIEVIGLGSPSFTVSNHADGTEGSYVHQLRVSYTLQTVGGKNGYQIIFYGVGEKIPYSVLKEDGSTFIYIPFQIHDQLKSRIEQSINARRKVQLKLLLKPSGVREATWIIN